jgi:GT2 family glycosyltransferase
MMGEPRKPVGSPTVSIIIANYNGLSLTSPNLADCLAAIASQDFIDFEIIVVDNGSTDGSGQFVMDNYPCAKVVRLNKNRGFVHANNIGLLHAKGRYVVLLNNDTQPHEAWLRELVTNADNHSEVSIFCSIQLPDQEPDRTRDIDVYGGVRVHEPNSDSPIVLSLFASGASCLVRREWLDRLGYLFDESYESFAEDLDLSIRTVLAGGRIAYVRSSFLWHRSGSTWKGMKRLDSSLLATRNEIVSYFKVLRAKSFLKLLISRLIYTVLRIIVKRRESRKNLSIVVGIAAGIVRLPLYVEKRRIYARIKRYPDQLLLLQLKFRTEKSLEVALWKFLAQG